MNIFFYTGRLGLDVKYHVAASGVEVCTFVIAVEKKKNKKSADTPKPDFLPITVFGKLAEACKKNLAKGRKILALGSTHVNRYINKETGEITYPISLIASHIEYLDHKKTSSKENSAEQQNKLLEDTLAASAALLDEIGDISMFESVTEPDAF